MRKIEVTAFELAQRFDGISEVEGPKSNTQILAMLQLVDPATKDDEVDWCSAFVNYIAWLLQLPRSNDLLARSWLRIGQPINLDKAEVGFDVVILKKDPADPGPDVLDKLGHVGFFAGTKAGNIEVLGGNQGGSVNVSSYPANLLLLGIRRLM